MVFVPRDAHGHQTDPTLAARAVAAFGAVAMPGSDASLVVSRTSPQLMHVMVDERRYVLKQLPWYLTDEQAVRFNVDLQDRLYRHGFAIPALLPSRDGSLSWQAETADGRKMHYIAQQFVPGRPFAGKPDEIRLAGRICARFALHAAACNDPPPPGAPFRQTAIETAAAAIADCRIRPISDRVMMLLDRVDLLLRDNAGDTARRLVHGDFNSTNLIFSADGAGATLIDYDDLAIGLPFEDFARGVLFFAGLRLREGALYYWPDVIDASSAATFAAGYAEIEPPDFDAIRRALVGVAAHVFCLGHLSRVWQDPDLDRADRFFAACAHGNVLEA